MQVIANLEEVGQFYRDLNDPKRLQWTERVFHFSYPEAASIELKYPDKLESLPRFARFLATLGYDEADFQGAMLWIANWGIWQEREERLDIDWWKVSAARRDSRYPSKRRPHTGFGEMSYWRRLA